MYAAEGPRRRRCAPPALADLLETRNAMTRSVLGLDRPGEVDDEDDRPED